MQATRNIFIIILALLVSGAVIASDKERLLDEKTALEQVQIDVDQSRQRLDSLKTEEFSTQREIASFDEKIRSNQKVVGRLNNQLGEIRQQIGSVDKALSQRQELLDYSKRRFLGDLRQLYVSFVTVDEQGLWPSPGSELETFRQSVYLAALTAFQSGNVAEAATEVDHTIIELTELTGEKDRVSSLKRNKEVETALEESRKSKEKKALEVLRRKATDESDRMLTLQQAAAEMEQVIARLERERRRRQQTQRPPSGPSTFAVLKGQLQAPYQGKIVVPFGPAIDPVTRLESFSAGITIQGKAGRPVLSVASGMIAYVGSLRGYGNFIIINHDDQYYTTYGGLGQTLVSQGEYTSAHAELAHSGKDGQVKFELRLGRQPLDPVKWIHIDSF